MIRLISKMTETDFEAFVVGQFLAQAVSGDLARVKLRAKIG